MGEALGEFGDPLVAFRSAQAFREVDLALGLARPHPRIQHAQVSKIPRYVTSAWCLSSFYGYMVVLKQKRPSRGGLRAGRPVSECNCRGNGTHSESYGSGKYGNLGVSGIGADTQPGNL